MFGLFKKKLPDCDFSEYGVDDCYVEKFKAAIAGVKGEWKDDEEVEE